MLSIKEKPINLVLMVLVICLYLLNNLIFKQQTTGIIQYFMICHFNDLICPMFFLSYSNVLLISINREMTNLKELIIFGFCAGVVWEFFAPLIKASSTPDIVDLICYLLGTTLYWWIQRSFQIIKHERLQH